MLTTCWELKGFRFWQLNLYSNFMRCSDDIVKWVLVIKIMNNLNSFLMAKIVVVLRMDIILNLTKIRHLWNVYLNHLPTKITFTGVIKPTCAVNGILNSSIIFNNKMVVVTVKKSNRCTECYIQNCPVINRWSQMNNWNDVTTDNTHLRGLIILMELEFTQLCQYTTCEIHNGITSVHVWYLCEKQFYKKSKQILA